MCSSFHYISPSRVEVSVGLYEKFFYVSTLSTIKTILKCLFTLETFYSIYSLVKGRVKGPVQSIKLEGVQRKKTVSPYNSDLDISGYLRAPSDLRSVNSSAFSL